MERTKACNGYKAKKFLNVVDLVDTISKNEEDSEEDNISINEKCEFEMRFNNNRIIMLSILGRRSSYL